MVLPAITALEAGHEVYVVTDASGSTTEAAQEAAMRRVVRIGAVPVTWMQIVLEWRRGRARTETARAVGDVVKEHGGTYRQGIEYYYGALRHAPDGGRRNGEANSMSRLEEKEEQELDTESSFLSKMELPPLPLEEWEDTKETLHRYAQVVGKIRMELSPPRNHWWHVTLYVTPRGLTTGPIPYPAGTFDISFDLLDNRLLVNTSEDGRFGFALDDLPVAEFYARLMGGLRSLGIDVSINPRPFDLDDEHTLEENTLHRACSRSSVRRYHRVLAWTDQVFKEYAGRFNGKQSPVHLYWHSFDLAVTRFSDRRADLPESTDPVTREAYSHEAISCGFWPGDKNVREPAFYSYTAPEPDGLTNRPLRPAAASWQEGGTALLTYEEVRGSASPKDALLEFLQSAYEAGAKTANWDVQDLKARPVRPVR